jgi:hypothetical protein
VAEWSAPAGRGLARDRVRGAQQRGLRATPHLTQRLLSVAAVARQVITHTSTAPETQQRIAFCTARARTRTENQRRSRLQTTAIVPQHTVAVAAAYALRKHQTRGNCEQGLRHQGALLKQRLQA